MLGALVAVLAPTARAGTAVGDGVVVDPAAGVVFVAAPGGGIDALALADGAVRWHAADADVPLATDGELLAAWVDEPGPTLRLVALDPGSGHVVRRCVGVALPHGIPGGVDDHLGDRRTVGARVEEGAIVAWWSASAWYAGGPAASEEHRRERTRSFAGAGSCGAKGVWSPAEAPAAAPPAPEPVPAALVGKVDGGRLLGGRWITSTCRDLGVQIGGGSPVGNAHLLQAWDPAAGTLVREQQAGRCGPPPEVRPAVDGEAFALPNPSAVYLYRSRDLAPIARLVDVPIADWVWTGEVVVTVGGGTLTVVGRHLDPRWTRPVRDRSYRGPIPQ